MNDQELITLAIVAVGVGIIVMNINSAASQVNADAQTIIAPEQAIESAALIGLTFFL
jgi:hypothetical protein